MSFETRRFVRVPADLLEFALNVMVMKDGPEREAMTRSFALALIQHLPPDESADLKALLNRLSGEEESQR